MTRLRDRRPWRWGHYEFSVYVLTALAMNLAADAIWSFTGWEEIPVAVTCYAIPVAVTAGFQRAALGKGRAR